MVDLVGLIMWLLYGITRLQLISAGAFLGSNSIRNLEGLLLSPAVLQWKLFCKQLGAKVHDPQHQPPFLKVAHCTRTGSDE